LRVVIEVLLLGGALAFVWVYGPIWWKRVRARKVERKAVPEIDGKLRKACAGDERLSEALEIRDRMAGYAARDEVGLDVRLVEDVDILIAGLVALTGTARELGQHLAGFTRERLERDAAVLDEGAITRQKGQVEALKQKRQALEAEVVRAVSGLREAWLSLIDALSRPHAGSPVSVAREQVEALNLRVQAEREARAVEVETA
jgi:hypothetical protein